MPTTPVTTATTLGAFEDLFNAGPAVAPTAVTYGSGWSDIGGGETSTAERVQGMVTVYLAASKASASTGGETICTLPANCWPKRKVRGWCNNTGGARPVSITTAGLVLNDVAQTTGNAPLVGSIVFPGA